MNPSFEATRHDNLLEVSQFLRDHQAVLREQLPPLGVYVAANYTLNGLEPFLRFQLLKAGFSPAPVFGLYGALAQEARTPGSPLYASSARLVVVSELPAALALGRNDAPLDVEATWADLEATLDLLVRGSTATVLVTSFPSPVVRESRLAAQSDATRDRVARLNAMLFAHAELHPGRVHVLELDRYLRTIGRAEGWDSRFWYMSRAPWRSRLLSLLAEDIAKHAWALAGRTKKVLVLDCDNTLWGGVVGEEGLDGIRLSAHEYPGNVFHDVQKQALALHAKGVLLALCTKNNEADVLEVLERHPSCLLKQEHLAAREINWRNKVDNLQAIARRLNLGLDSLVFVDDSPYECELVRELLPEVTVLQVPTRLHEYPDLLPAADPFYAPSLTVEDRERTRLYRVEAERQELRERSTDLKSYLLSLRLEAAVHRARDEELPRVAQLTQKTNQWNVTTRRYSEGELRALVASPEHSVYVLHARDRFGDLGLTNVLIARRDESGAHEIDTLLMSCRVIERGLEHAFLLHCLDDLASRTGADRFKAAYRRTLKNVLVEGFWESVGFEVVEATAEQKLYRARRSQLLSKDTDHIALAWE